jgi:hypothetical protein
LLDTNHDAGLSIRAQRNAWQALEAVSYVSDSLVDAHQIPNVLLFAAAALAHQVPAASNTPYGTDDSPARDLFTKGDPPSETGLAT